MKDKDFLLRLRQELPRWIEKGFVQAQYEKAIIETVKDSHQMNDENRTSLKPSFFVFSFLGLSLLAVGIILFFASHWQMIPKISKLALLFCSLWFSYAIAAYLLIKKQGNSALQWLAQLLLVLAVIIFGTNIALISQIYHIDAHFPNGILIWSLGAWLVAVLLKQQACMVISLGLAFIWSVTESEFFIRSIHWLFIPIYILNIIPILKEKWELSLHIALIILILWLSNNILWLDYSLDLGYKLNYYSYYFGICSLGSIGLFCLCLIGLERNQKQKEDNPTNFPLKTVQHYTLFFFLLNLFYLSFPNVLVLGGRLESIYLVITASLFSIVILSFGYFYKTIDFITERHLLTGFLLTITLGILLIINYFNYNYSWLALGFNLIFVSFILWFITIGFELKDKIYINIAFLFFALFIIARYFDVFWDLLNRSFFFMGGGLLLLLGSFILERKRRSITRNINDQ